MVVAMQMTNARMTDVQRVQFTHQLVGQGRTRFQMVMIANADNQAALQENRMLHWNLSSSCRVALVDTQNAARVYPGV